MTDAQEGAGVFGGLASLYDRSRPGYPSELFDELFASCEAGRVLEAGAGTGIATRELARRAAFVQAIEPDPEMAELARRNTAGLAVQVQQSLFEQCDPAPASFDVVASFQAWQWIEPAAGSAVAAGALVEGGRLALCWNRPRDFDGPVWDAVHAVYARHAPQLDRRPRLAAQDEREASFDPANGFGPWTRQTFDWSTRYSAEDYRDLVSTHSDHQRLDPELRERVLDEVAAAIEATGGVLEHRYRSLLVQAPSARG